MFSGLKLNQKIDNAALEAQTIHVTDTAYKINILRQVSRVGMAYALYALKVMKPTYTHLVSIKVDNKNVKKQMNVKKTIRRFDNLKTTTKQSTSHITYTKCIQSYTSLVYEYAKRK